MKNNEPNNEIKQIFKAHGLHCAIENDWLFPNNELPAIRTLWYPKEKNGQLDIQVFIGKGVLIEECFGGIGHDSEAFHDALGNFMVNSLHVFLAALWGLNDPEQVTTETWMIGERIFTAYIGNYGIRTSEGGCAPIPENLFESIETAIKKEILKGDIHWIRTYYGNVAGMPTFEALLDNEEWAAGLDCLKAIQWEKSSGFYSIRNFIMLRAA